MFPIRNIVRWGTVTTHRAPAEGSTDPPHSITHGPLTVRLEQQRACTFHPWVDQSIMAEGLPMPTWICAFKTSPWVISMTWCLAFHDLQLHDSAMWSCSWLGGFKQMCGSRIRSPGFESILISGWMIIVCGESTDLYPFRPYSDSSVRLDSLSYCSTLSVKIISSYFLSPAFQRGHLKF